MANHDKGCICCRRIANDVSKYTSTVTKQSYTIDGNYTCKTNNCIYLVTCGICDKQYVEYIGGCGGGEIVTYV